MSQTPLGVAIDVGATSAKLALVTRRGRVVIAQIVPTGPRTAPSSFCRIVSAVVRQYRDHAARQGAQVVGLGVGVPGVVDVPQGMVRYMVNMPRWRRVPLRRTLERLTHLPTVVDNDVNVMTWGEYRWGAGRGARSLVCLTLGTGVGGGVVLDGRLWRGWTMSAGEIGHLPLAWDGPRCACGGRACLERYVGNREIVALARRRLAAARRRLRGTAGMSRLTPEDLDRAAALGDPIARAVWREVGEQIGLALTSVVNLINPERIVIGGGIARAGRWLFPAMRATVRRRAMRGAGAVAIVPARWGAEAGVVGAAAMLFERSA